MSSSANTESYAEVCRELVRRACYLQRISKQDLAAQLGLHPKAIGAQVYRGQLGLPKAIALAERAEATPEELLTLQRAWLLERTHRDAKPVMARLLAMIDSHRSELIAVSKFLREQNLFEQYLRTRGETSVLDNTSSTLPRL